MQKSKIHLRLEIGDWRLEIGDWRLEIGVHKQTTEIFLKSFWQENQKNP
jgi:hypothetical protein